MARRSASARKEPEFDIDVAPAVSIDPVKDRAARLPVVKARDKSDADSEPAPRRSSAKSESKRDKSAPGKRRRGGGGGFTWRRALYWAVVLALWVVIGGIGAIVWVGMHLPPLQSLEIPHRPPSIQILAIDGKPLAIRGEGNGSIVTLKDMPPYLPKAFLAIEDRLYILMDLADCSLRDRTLRARRGQDQGRLRQHAVRTERGDRGRHPGRLPARGEAGGRQAGRRARRGDDRR